MAKVIFLHLSVILFTGGVCPLPGRTPLPARENPPACQGDPPGPDPPPPGPDPPPGSRLQHTINERPVRILLECILVLYGRIQFRCKWVCYSFSLINAPNFFKCEHLRLPCNLFFIGENNLLNFVTCEHSLNCLISSLLSSVSWAPDLLCQWFESDLCMC